MVTSKLRSSKNQKVKPEVAATETPSFLDALQASLGQKLAALATVLARSLPLSATNTDSPCMRRPSLKYYTPVILTSDSQTHPMDYEVFV